jgi:CDGSH-type Zn-finger protein
MMMSSLKNIRRIKVMKDGPYIVSGGVPLARERVVIGSDGEPARWEKGPAYPARDSYALCRCGQSKHKPFCDGSHSKIAFEGTETAGRGAALPPTIL